MKVAIVNESSAADKNAMLAETVSSLGHEVVNIGMKSADDEHKLNYLHIGVLTAVFIHAKRADLVIGGCGTGHGYTMVCMQFPGVYCSTCFQPLDTWITQHINAPNVLSFSYNKGYGWGSEINIKFMLERFFEVEPGSGFPKHRKDVQVEGKRQLVELSKSTHLPMHEALLSMDRDVAKHALMYPGVKELLDIDTIEDEKLKAALIEIYNS